MGIYTLIPLYQRRYRSAEKEMPGASPTLGYGP